MDTPLLLGGSPQNPEKRLPPGTAGKVLHAVHERLTRAGYPTTSDILPVLFNLKGAPYTLKDHFIFEPLFRTQVPERTALMVARQSSKSTSSSTRSIMHCAGMPHLSLLYVTPLYEQVRRISTNYVREFIDNSPIKHLLLDKKSMASVLQRTFRNNSKLIFSFAYTDASRVRGVAADELVLDEVQEMQKDNIGVILECISYSRFKTVLYAGTPLSPENILSSLFSQSSQAEWVVKCPACNKLNIPSLQHDLLKMIGPWRPDISEEKPGLICAKCQRPLNPRPPNGRWRHAFKDRRWDFVGYHAPQMILPLHYAKPKGWREVLRKQMHLPNYMFANEVCGEPAGTGERLVSEKELRNACSLGHPNKEAEVMKKLGNYTERIIACDWGGGGAQFISWTVIVMLGMTPDGKIEVPWAHRSLMPHEHIEEAKLTMIALTRFRCPWLIHDYGGAGGIRETLVHASGFPQERIQPVVYSGTMGGTLIREHAPAPHNPRFHIQLNKARALQMVCSQIKLGGIRFFDYDYVDDTNPGLMRDFSALMEEEHRGRAGKHNYVVASDPNMTDDFAQAVTMGCCWLWYHTKRWPNLGQQSQMEMPQELVRELGHRNYDDLVGESFVPWH